MISKELISQIVSECFEGSDCYLVDLVLTLDKHIIIEIDALKGVSIDDCVHLNRFLADRLSPEIEDYELEVSSAGITQPFKVLRQYQNNRGKEVEVLTRDGQKQIGILGEANEHHFELIVAKQVKPEGAKRKVTVEETLTITYNEVKTTKMIIRFK
jgi:ribosome maturation factor RimP